MKVAIYKISRVYREKMEAMFLPPNGMTDIHFYVCCTAFSLATIVLARLRKNRARANPEGLPLPPGPKPLPFVGNIFQLNVSKPWITYTRWRKVYGDIVYSRIFGFDFIIINSEKVARDLLEKRSAIYSGRPIIPATTIFGMDFVTGLLPYGDKWRLHRRIFNQALGTSTVLSYRDLQLRKIRELLLNVLNTPEDFEVHLKTLSISIIMAITYGYGVAPINDPVVNRVLAFVKLFVKALTPECAIIISITPFLDRIPPWLPGGSLTRDILKCRKLAFDVQEVPFEYTKSVMATGLAPKSMVSDVLKSNIGKSGAYNIEQELKESAATVFLGGAETTDSTLLTFIMAMVLHPDVQRRAQEEIDTVVGVGRLPSFDDRSSLPFVEAVYRETLRWHVPVPLAIPHVASTSDMYEGYFIPKGALVIVNLWAMTHDEERFPDPNIFNPERYLNSDGQLMQDNTTALSFGFGRRICPGKGLAKSTTWAAMVSMLATFRFSKAKDADGCEIEIEPIFTSGAAIHPCPFACSIVPRTAEAEGLVRREKMKG